MRANNTKRLDGVARDPVEGHVALARAGEGIDRRIREDIEWNAFYFAGVAAGLIAACGFAWIVEFFTPGAGLTTLTVGSVLAAAYLFWRIVRMKRALRLLRRGMRGEVAVGEVLEGLRERGYRVFHDVGSEGRGNIDHVVIGASGIYVIETKTRSLPARSAHGKAVVVTDGQRVRVGDGPWDEGPIRQVCAVRGRVREWLKGEGMGDWDVRVRAVVMYPGWWVEGSSGKEVWVLKPEALGKWIEREERDVRPLADDRLRMLVGRFEKYARGLVEAERERA